MGEDIDGKSGRGLMRDIGDLYDTMISNVSMISGTLNKLFLHDPDRAIGEIGNEFELRKKGEYGEDAGYVCAVTGGPNEGVVAPIYNAVGMYYPKLSPDQKSKALDQVFKIIDRYAYPEVQSSHISVIREPLLFSDITTAVPLYWPGIYEGERIVEWYRGMGYGFKDGVTDIIDSKGMFDPKRVNSDFIVAYSLMRSDVCDYGEQYVEKANPQFLGRVMQGIVQKRFVNSPFTVEEGTQRLKELLPKSTHHLIDPIRENLDLVHIKEYVKSVAK